MKTWIAGVLVAGLGAGVVGMASAHQGGPGQISFETLDTNGDGKLTLAEMAAQKKARFTATDTNGDGMLSADEMLAQGKARMGDRMAKRMEPRIGKMIERRDANGDGMLSIGEMEATAKGDLLFERLDANGDGAISAEEYAARKGERGMRRGAKPMSE
ncbi:MAG: calcium-binding protein [Marinosulfonomonas sp.]|nr:calcium-binding protein [Marinosulfonomonas sp.]